jgi:hypothetical protein
MPIGRRADAVDYSFAVKPMPRDLVAEGFINSLMAERMAAPLNHRAT